LTNGVVDSYSDLAKRTLSALADLLTMAERAAANGGKVLPTDELSHLLPEITSFTERLRFNVPYRGPQKFAWSEIPLDEVKAIRRAFGTSVNDVVLALVTATVRRYLESHGDHVKGRLFRMMVPVNLRGSESADALGNRISLVPVTIPLDIRDPKKLLSAVHRRTEFLKHSHAAELVSLAGGLIGMFPTPLQALAGPFLSQLPVTPFNLVCTNVPGPQHPLYMHGHKMLRWYPYVPIGGEMAANCAILSYNGAMYFGFSGDVHATPDLPRFETFLAESFQELRAACTGGSTSRTAKQKKQKKVRKRPVGARRPAKAPSMMPVSENVPEPIATEPSTSLENVAMLPEHSSRQASSRIPAESVSKTTSERAVIASA
jgi:diacylglycerol O-acyltransferase